MERMSPMLHNQNKVAIIWDFDKTLIPGYMQAPLFRHFGIDEKRFWDEVNALPAYYARKGMRVAGDTIYLNHMLTYVKHGRMRGLNNRLLFELGAQLTFYPGLPTILSDLKALARSKPEYLKHDIVLEHYIISTGLAEMIRGSAIAPYVAGIFGSELIENPLPPDFDLQKEFPLDGDREVSQMGIIVDNTSKTRYLFEINKGSNKNPAIDVNSDVKPEDRRVPFQNMIYIADGPSDIPVFSVVKRNGGLTYAVYEPANRAEFAQNDQLLRVSRIHSYGPADYRPESSTSMWLKMHVEQICNRIVKDREYYFSMKVARPPRHLHPESEEEEKSPEPPPATQAEFF